MTLTQDLESNCSEIVHYWSLKIHLKNHFNKGTPPSKMPDDFLKLNFFVQYPTVQNSTNQTQYTCFH